MHRYVCTLAQPFVGSCGLTEKQTEKQTLCRCEQACFLHD